MWLEKAEIDSNLLLFLVGSDFELRTYTNNGHLFR